MGLFSSLFGKAPKPPPIDPEVTLKDTLPYWESYNQYVHDVNQDFEQKVKSMETARIRGTLTEEQYQARVNEYAETRDVELATINSGPTANILREEFEFQAQHHREQFDKSQPKGTYVTFTQQDFQKQGRDEVGSPQPPVPVPGTYRVFTNRDEVGERYVYAPDGPPVYEGFGHDSFESFYEERFGKPKVTNSTAPASDVGLGNTRQRLGGSSSSTAAIGLGRRYQIY